MGVLGGKIGEGVVRYWPPTNSFLVFGVLTSVPILVKIDQEMRPWECSQTDRHTDRQTDRQTDANRFYNLSHAICYSYGTDNKTTTNVTSKNDTLDLYTVNNGTIISVLYTNTDSILNKLYNLKLLLKHLANSRILWLSQKWNIKVFVTLQLVNYP